MFTGGGKRRDLGTLPGFSGSEGNAINNWGEVAGDLVNDPSLPGSSKEHAFLYSHGVMTSLGTLPGAYSSSAAVINSSGQVAGCCRSVLGGFHVIPFLYDPRKKIMTALPMPPSYTTGYVYAMNDRGHIAGRVLGKTSLGYVCHAALWIGGKLTDLGAASGYDDSDAKGLNNQGDIVGQSSREASTFQLFLQRYTGRDDSQIACLWRNGKVQDLNMLIPTDADWTLLGAQGINDRGQMVGYGLHHGQGRAFLLTPI